jgi:60 kDa SS-A/Ro ribonucleoprotein
MAYLNNIFGNGATPQSEPLAARPDQIKNSAGGYVWGVDNWMRLERFLILGA